MSDFEKFKVGDKAELTKTISEEDVKLFAQITNDKNPIHLDKEYAKSTPFGQPIIHGILQSGLISAVLAQDLPGPGSIYREQTLTFKKPAYVGETLTAKVEVLEIIPKLRLLVLKTQVLNDKGQVLIVGKAKGIVPAK